MRDDGLDARCGSALDVDNDLDHRMDVGVFRHAPSLDGRLSFDAASRRQVARDAGGIVSRLPAAVLQPASTEDVVRMVRFCGRHGVGVAARGQGHTTFGQSQVGGGLVIDMSALHVIHGVGDNRAVVDAGVTWRRLLVAAAAVGRTPPVLTGFQGLSVGGTLSAGGISGMAYDKGAQVDQVLELQVVTGGGHLVTCSAEQHQDLLAAVLGGMGRCALIVRAIVRLVPSQARVRHSVVSHRKLAPFLRDLRTLAARRALDGVSGTISLEAPSHAGAGVRYDINAISFFTPPGEPDTARLLRGLDPAATIEGRDRDYLDHHLQVDRLIDGLIETGGWRDVVHPWFDVFLPDRGLDAYLEETLGELSPAEDVGPPPLGALGQIHLFPLWTRHLQRPLLRVPGGDLVFLFDILTAAHAPGRDPNFVGRMLARNRRLFERARALGGTRYDIAAIPLSEADWIEQLGPARAAFVRQKRLHDPHVIMATDASAGETARKEGSQ